jgi:hypothetical protein
VFAYLTASLLLAFCIYNTGVCVHVQGGRNGGLKDAGFGTKRPSSVIGTAIPQP